MNYSQIVHSHASISVTSITSYRDGSDVAILLLHVELWGPVVAHILFDLARGALGRACLLEGHGGTKARSARYRVYVS